MKNYLKFGILILILGCVFMSCQDSGSGNNDTRTVLIIDGNEVTYDEYRYFFMNTKFDMDGGDESFWTPENERKLKDTVLEILCDNYAIYRIADDYEIVLDSEMKKAVNQNVQATIEQYGGSEETYYEMLEAHYLTGDCYRKLLELEELDMKVRDYLMSEFTSDIFADDAAIEADFAENFVRATHILIVHNNGKTDEANMALMNEIQTRLSNGEDFNELLTQYGQDTGLDKENGYYITKGLYNKVFEDTAFALGINEISGIVESSVGYHIIKRLELDENYLYDNLEYIRSVYKTRKINEKYEYFSTKLPVEYKDLYYEINTSAMK